MGSDELVPVMSITPEEAVKQQTEHTLNQIIPELPFSPAEAIAVVENCTSAVDELIGNLDATR